MNNFRLSTYKGVVKSLSQEEIEKLLSAPPTIEHLLDGRVIDRTTKKVLPKQNSCVYEICEEDGIFILANSLTEAASIVGLYPDTLSKYLDIEVLNSEGVFLEVKKHKALEEYVYFCRALLSSALAGIYLLNLFLYFLRNYLFHFF